MLLSSSPPAVVGLRSDLSVQYPRILPFAFNNFVSSTEKCENFDPYAGPCLFVK